MSVHDQFSAPKKTCRWAVEEIDSFEAAEKAFFDTNPSKEWEHLDYAKCQIVHGIRFTEKPSDELERGAYRIVGDLRNALDQAMYAASKVFETKNLKKSNFPFGESAKDFQNALTAKNGNYRGIPIELHPILTSFQPFWTNEGSPDGNDILRGLTAIANSNKHRVPLDIKIGHDLYIGNSKNVISSGKALVQKGKIELYRTIPDLPYEIEIILKPVIALARIEKLAGKAALATFREMHTIVDGIILGLEEEVLQLRA